jgi:hypothetical protein
MLANHDIKNLIRHMLVRGDYVAIKKGRLTITPKSKKTIPNQWLTENVQLIENELISTLSLVSYRYENFTTGLYDVHNGKKEGGVTLHYNNVLTGDSPRLTYTVPLTRDRTTKHGKKGQPLPKNRFRVSSRMAFYKFWLNLELPLPTRLSAFHDCMGKLSGVLLTGTCTTSTKGSSLDKENLAMLEVSHAEILSVYTGAEEIQLPDNQLTSTRQTPDNLLTKVPDKKTQQSHTTHELASDSTTGEQNPGNKVIREDGYKDSHTTIPIDPRKQTVSQWRDAYK